MSSWRKPVPITGVGSSSSIVNLKAQIFEGRHHRTQAPIFRQKKAAARSKDETEPADEGLASRNRADLMAARAEDPNSKAARKLEEKSILYERIARGEVKLPSRDEDEEEGYLVDFARKTCDPDAHSRRSPPPPPPQPQPQQAVATLAPAVAAAAKADLSEIFAIRQQTGQQHSSGCPPEVAPSIRASAQKPRPTGVAIPPPDWRPCAVPSEQEEEEEGGDSAPGRSPLRVRLRDERAEPPSWLGRAEPQRAQPEAVDEFGRMLPMRRTFADLQTRSPPERGGARSPPHRDEYALEGGLVRLPQRHQSTNASEAARELYGRRQDAHARAMQILGYESSKADSSADFIRPSETPPNAGRVRLAPPPQTKPKAPHPVVGALRPMATPPSNSRVLELLESLRQEFEKERGSVNLSREQYEKKLEEYRTEAESLNQVIVTLERNMTQMKQKYEDEIQRLQREIQMLTQHAGFAAPPAQASRGSLQMTLPALHPSTPTTAAPLPSSALLFSGHSALPPLTQNQSSQSPAPAAPVPGTPPMSPAQPAMGPTVAPASGPGPLPQQQTPVGVLSIFPVATPVAGAASGSPSTGGGSPSAGTSTVTLCGTLGPSGPLPLPASGSLAPQATAAQLHDPIPQPPLSSPPPPSAQSQSQPPPSAPGAGAATTPAAGLAPPVLPGLGTSVLPASVRPASPQQSPSPPPAAAATPGPATGISAAAPLVGIASSDAPASLSAAGASDPALTPLPPLGAPSAEPAMAAAPMAVEQLIPQ
ncbi:hypothetical protein PAPYR_1915 [Paratrimastix pyriformis]|uniref:Transcriptional repressor Tup1 N-terminal domain-containing protein n=1 Tax=Paratrimastix pyriformis TaxID=342808 RepID=A0ABQ8URM1_9EUKA|nr:hypothetical protein PAPYR_1915 [Paratrimastix pyriformis]